MEAKMKLLTAALQTRENDLRRVVDRLRDGEALREGDGWLLREATELVGCLRRLASSRTLEEIHHAFGAPGDFGYETPIGEALSKVYRGESTGTVTATESASLAECLCGHLKAKHYDDAGGAGCDPDGEDCACDEFRARGKNARLDTLCRCGHRYGVHIDAQPSPCEHTTGDKLDPFCHCEAFAPAE